MLTKNNFASIGDLAAWSEGSWRISCLFADVWHKLTSERKIRRQDRSEAFRAAGWTLHTIDAFLNTEDAIELMESPWHYSMLQKLAAASVFAQGG